MPNHDSLVLRYMELALRSLKYELTQAQLDEMAEIRAKLKMTHEAIIIEGKRKLLS